MPSIRRRGETLPDHEALDIVDQQQPAVVVHSTDAGVEAPPTLPQDLLNAPVGLDDDLSHALAARPPRRRLPGVTAVLVAALLVSGGFLGGVLVQKHEGGSGGTANAAALAAAFGRNRTGTGANRAGTGTATGTPAGTGAASTGAAGAAGAGSTVGTVKLVDGTTVYVTTLDGSIVKVTTSKDTTIKVAKSGTAGDLAPGTTVLVQGTAGTDGVVKATSVTDAGSGAAFPGGFGGFGGRNRAGTGGTGAATQGAGN